MDGFEVDTDMLREHARHVRDRAGEAAVLAPAALAMAADPGAFGIALAPLGSAMAVAQAACGVAIGGVGGVLAVTGVAVEVLADSYDVTDTAVRAVFRAGQEVLR